jgi:hypothetical protein
MFHPLTESAKRSLDEIYRSIPYGTCRRCTNQRHEWHSGAHNLLGAQHNKDWQEVHRLKRWPSLTSASPQPNSGVKNGQAREKIIQNITKTELNQGLRSNAVHTSSDVTQKTAATSFQRATCRRTCFVVEKSVEN